MKKQFWIICFLLVLVANIAGMLIPIRQLEIISKPLLMPVLMAYAFFYIRGNAVPYKKWVLFALFFSWAGDLLLMFQASAELYFLLGLSAFLLAHVFYIIFFHQLRIREGIKSNPWFLVIVVVYYAALVSWLSPYLGTMKLPVRIYGIVISFMFMLAMHMLFLKERQAGKWMMAGALLFVISDSLLAINKFYQPFEMAGAAIMLTYGLAQLFITEGAVRYGQSPESR